MALHKWFGLANYLHKYIEYYADMARPSSNLLKRTCSDAGLAPNPILLEQLKIVSYMRQYWLFPIMIGLLVSSVTHPTFP